MAREFLKVRENYGSGEEVDLSRAKLSSLQRVCDPFRKLIEKNCNNYALYRCTLTSDGDIIYAVLLGSDDKGNLGELQFGYNMLTEEVYTRKIKVKDEESVGRELYNLVLNLLKLVPYSVGMLNFPIEGYFKKGSMMDYNKEKDTVLIIVEDSLDNSYFID